MSLPLTESTTDLSARAFAVLSGVIRRRLGLGAVEPAAGPTDELGAELARQVRWHRVRGLVETDPLARSLLGAAPSGTSARDRLTARLIELTVVLKRLQQAAIPAIPLKGVLLSSRLYGDPTLRGFHDHDVLVPRERLDDAIAALAPDYLPDGFSRRSREACEHHEVLRPTAGGSLIELHWRLLNPYSGYVEAPGIAWKSPQRRSDAGLAYLTLDPAVEAVMITVHAAHHFGARLHWLADVAALILRLAPGDWERALALAEGSRVRRALLTAVGAANLTFDVPLPSVLSGAVREDAAMGSAEWIARRLHAGATRHPSQFQRWFHRCAIMEDWRSRLTVIPRLAFTPIPEDHAATGLPPWAASMTGMVRPILILGRALKGRLK